MIKIWGTVYTNTSILTNNHHRPDIPALTVLCWLAWSEPEWTPLALFSSTSSKSIGGLFSTYLCSCWSRTHRSILADRTASEISCCMHGLEGLSETARPSFSLVGTSLRFLGFGVALEVLGMFWSSELKYCASFECRSTKELLFVVSEMPFANALLLFMSAWPFTALEVDGMSLLLLCDVIGKVQLGLSSSKPV